MATGTSAQLAVGTEGTYGVAGTLSRFLEINSHDLRPEINYAQGRGLRGGRYFAAADRRVETTRRVVGNVKQDVLSKGLGVLFAHALGSAATPVQQAATTAYKQTHSPGALTGRSLTLQPGIPRVDSTTVDAETFTGCKITGFEVSCGVDDIAELSWDVVGKNITTATALATASYPTGANPLHFAQGTLTVNGSAVAGVRKATVNYANAQEGRFYLDGTGLTSEPVETDYRSVSGSLDVDYLDTSWRDFYLGNTTIALVLNFTGANIASTYYETLKITVPAVKLTGGMPDVAGPGLTQHSVPFVGLDDRSTNPVTVEYISTDTTN